MCSNQSITKVQSAQFVVELFGNDLVRGWVLVVADRSGCANTGTRVEVW